MKPIKQIYIDSITCVIDIKELAEWSKRWLMTFNPDKTEIMLFTNLEHPEINFTLEDNIISTIESHRHLGVAFSTDDTSQNSSKTGERVFENNSLLSFIQITMKPIKQIYIDSITCVINRDAIPC
jgi:hypothetical protein